MPTIPNGDAPYRPLRKANGQFAKGVSGNIKGRTLGVRSRVSKRILARLETETDEILSGVIDAARNGDMQSSRFLLGLLIPKSSKAPIDLGDSQLPNLDSVEALAAAHESVIKAVASGVLDSDGGHALSALLAEQRKQLELVNLQKRIEKLEAADEPLTLDLEPLPDHERDDDAY